MSEPAAWFYQYPGETGIFMCADAKAMEGLEEKGYILTPLYTHPEKTLTDRIAVLEANHKIQLEISNKQMEYISLLEDGLESSIKLNKAQIKRTQEK